MSNSKLKKCVNNVNFQNLPLNDGENVKMDKENKNNQSQEQETQKEQTQRKYEFTGKQKRTMYGVVSQIRRLSDGKLGGWIQKEENLSHKGNCWIRESVVVSDEARVSENAQVFNNVYIVDHAQVSGHVSVGGHTVITGHAQVYGDCRVFGGHIHIGGHSQVYGGSHVYGNVYIDEQAKVYKMATLRGDMTLLGKSHTTKDPIFLSLPNLKVTLTDNYIMFARCSFPLGQFIEDSRGLLSQNMGYHMDVFLSEKDVEKYRKIILITLNREDLI